MNRNNNVMLTTKDVMIVWIKSIAITAIIVSICVTLDIICHY